MGQGRTLYIWCGSGSGVWSSIYEVCAPLSDILVSKFLSPPSDMGQLCQMNILIIKATCAPPVTWVEPGILCPSSAAVSQPCASDSSGSSLWIPSRLLEPLQLPKFCGGGSFSSSSEGWRRPLATAGTSCVPCSSSRPPADKPPPPPQYWSPWWIVWGGCVATIAAEEKKRRECVSILWVEIQAAFRQTSQF